MSVRLLLGALAALCAVLANAQPTFEDAGASTVCASGTTCELPAPTDVSGEAPVAVCEAADDFVGITSLDINETGYTGYDSTNSLGTDTSATIEAKISAGSEPANLTCQSGSAIDMRGKVLQFSAVHADVWDQTAAQCADAENAQTWPPSDCSITTQTDNALVCYVVHKGGGGTDITVPMGWTERIDGGDAAWTTNDKLAMACIVKATAGVQTLAAGALNSGTGTTDWGGMLVALKAVVVDTTAPTLTNPDTASVGETTVTPAVDTNEDNGTMYMVVVPDADVPSVAQIKAGQQSSGAAAIAADNDAISATGTHTFAQVTGLTASTNYEIYYVHTDAAANDSTAATVGFVTNAAAGGVFDVAPTCSPSSDTTYACAGSLDAAGVVYFVSCPKDQTAPTGVQIEVAHCTGGLNAMANDSDSPTVSPFNFSGTLTLINGVRISDVYVWDGDSVVALVDQELDCPAASNCVTLTGAPTTPPLSATDCTTGDLVRIDDATLPNGYPTTLNADGSMTYEAGFDNSRQRFAGDCYDVSAETLDLYD